MGVEGSLWAVLWSPEMEMTAVPRLGRGRGGGSGGSWARGKARRGSVVHGEEDDADVAGSCLLERRRGAEGVAVAPASCGSKRGIAIRCVQKSRKGSVRCARARQSTGTKRSNERRLRLTGIDDLRRRQYGLRRAIAAAWGHDSFVRERGMEEEAVVLLKEGSGQQFNALIVSNQREQFLPETAA